MKILRNIMIPFVVATFAFSCCKGGAGGDATITASTHHHSRSIPGAIVYVKYNATELPGTSPSNYDTKFIAGPTDFSVKCTGLKCGNYYLYATAYDSSIMQPVTGGVAVKISYSERKKNADIWVPVTE